MAIMAGRRNRGYTNHNGGDMAHMNDQFMWGYQRHFRLVAELRN